MAAARLHRQIGSRDRVEREGGNIDVFHAILQLELPLLLRPLRGLLGAYLRDPMPGVLVTTQRSLSIQRFTAAHELGHFRLNHDPSRDDEDILRRSPFAARPGYDMQEVEADAFAVAFLIPRWLIMCHCERYGWRAADFSDPIIVYQLSLRLGTSFEATWRTLQRYKIIEAGAARGLEGVRVRDLKANLLGDYQPPDYHRDVWLLTERDAGTSINGSHHDLFVLRLKEHSGGGYLWNTDQLERSGFAVVRDAREAIDADGVGSPTYRRVTALLEEAQRGRISLGECRPWQPGNPLNRLELGYDFSGPEEEGYSKVERRRMLEAA